jgi:hypothetical protein
VHSHNPNKQMSEELTPITKSGEPIIYQIRIHGHLDSQWKDWFEGLALTLEDNGDTLLTGPVIDQAALHGLLKKVRDLAIPLLSVIRVEPSQSNVAKSKPLNSSTSLEKE